MVTFPVYKAIKEQLKEVAPCFFYIGQYTKGNNNTKYIVPAIYIEIPKDLKITYWGRGIRAAKDVIIRVHLINNAPYKAHDNVIQDSALAAHNAMLDEIDEALHNKHLSRAGTRTKLSERFLSSGNSEMNYLENQVVSVLSYTADLYF